MIVSIAVGMLVVNIIAIVWSAYQLATQHDSRGLMGVVLGVSSFSLIDTSLELIKGLAK